MAPARWVARLLTSLLVGAMAWMGMLAPPSQARSGGGAVLVVHGAGDGHGVGMSQWGAMGYAEHGWSDTQILRHYYTGTAIGHISRKRKIRVLVGSKVERVPIEAYVRGVVAAEVPASWPLAALEAQAIASRTYGITARAGGARFDVYNDTRSQVYIGRAAETRVTNQAVRETAGEVVTYGGTPVLTPFFASSGGMTESIQNSFLGSAPEPWLVGVRDQFDGGPLHRWTIRIPFAKAAGELAGLVRGTFKGIEVTKRGVSPRIVAAYVLGSKGRTEVSGPELALRLGLYCAWAQFSVERGGKVRREPDISKQGQAPSTSPEATPQGGEGTPAEAKVQARGKRQAQGKAPAGDQKVPPAGVDGGAPSPAGETAASQAGGKLTTVGPTGGVAGVADGAA